MVQFTQELEIDAPPEAVWEVLGDYPNVYRWAPIVKHSRQASENAQGPGAARACEVPGFGKVTETVERWSDGESFSFVWEASGPVRGGRSTWALRRAGSGSKVTVDIEAEMRYGLLGELMGRTIIKPMMRRMISDALKGLDHYVRTGEHVDRGVARRLGLRAA